jgi:hypothetical protein
MEGTNQTVANRSTSRVRSSRRPDDEIARGLDALKILLIQHPAERLPAAEEKGAIVSWMRSMSAGVTWPFRPSRSSRIWLARAPRSYSAPSVARWPPMSSS